MGGEQSGCTSQSLAPRALGPLLPAGCCWRTWGDSRYHPWAAGTAHQCLRKVTSQHLSGWPRRRQLHSSLEYLWPQSLIELEWAYYIVTMLSYTSSFSTNSMLSRTATCILIKNTIFITMYSENIKRFSSECGTMWDWTSNKPSSFHILTKLKSLQLGCIMQYKC